MQKFSIREALSFGFKAYREHWKTLMAGSLLITLPVLFFQVYALFASKYESAVQLHSAMKPINYVSEHPLILVFGLVMYPLMLVLMYGYTKIALQIHDYNSGSLEALFSFDSKTRSFLMSMIGAICVVVIAFLGFGGVLYGVALSLRNTPFIIPFFIVSLFVIIVGMYSVIFRGMFFYLALVDGKQGIKNAFSYSWTITKGSFWRLLGLILAVGISFTFFSLLFELAVMMPINILSQFALPYDVMRLIGSSIGGVVVWPFMTMSMVYVYRKLGAAYSFNENVSVN